MNEKLFVGELNNWYQWYLSEEGTVNYAINSILYINTLQEKYIKMYEKSINQIKDVCQCDKSSFKGLLTNFNFAPNKAKGNFKRY